MRVSEPSTCGWMLAERRDFTVATYSSTRGTGVRLTVCVLTGRGCGAGCFASVLLHPELARRMRPNNPTKRTTVSFLNLTILKTPALYYRCVPYLARFNMCTDRYSTVRCSCTAGQSLELPLTKAAPV